LKFKILERKRLKFKHEDTTTIKTDTAQDNLQRRLAVLGIIILAAFCVLFARLWFMQIVSGNNYRKMAESNRIREISIDAPRGIILDRNGRVLVRNRSSLTISVVPAELGGDKKVIEKLSNLLGLGQSEIKYKIEKSQAPNRRAVLIKSDVGEDIVTYVREHQLDFPGVIAGTKAMREYPGKQLAAHLIGYLGEISPEVLKAKKGKGYQAGDEIGLSGVEATYDEELRGKVGLYRLEVDAAGNSIRALSRREPRAGENLQLTIDENVQAVVENALKSQVEVARSHYDSGTNKNYVASGASAVVLDPKTGEIIAMASYPTFDLNSFVGGISNTAWKKLMDPANMYPLNNRAIMSQLPPGSTFKAVTAIAGLTEGIVNPNTLFYCQHIFNEGPFKNYPKYCWGQHGHIDLFNGIIQSCDTVFYTIGDEFYNRQVKNEGRPLWEYARDFQLGQRTGIDLVGEMDGRVPTPEWKKEFNKNNPTYGVWYPGDTVNMAIGQGDLLVTPLQMARLYAGVANGGKFVRPHLMKSLEDADGHVLKKAAIENTGELAVDSKVIDFVNQALTGVVKGKGTAAATFNGFPLNQVQVAGKTGTSEIVGKQPTAWFVCYAPAPNPQYVVAVAIEQGGHGGESAAPVARRIIEGLFNIKTQGEIPPSAGD
jgi:penicillin-binding protein 2